jgi:hypothetical protein
VGLSSGSERFVALTWSSEWKKIGRWSESSMSETMTSDCRTSFCTTISSMFLLLTGEQWVGDIVILQLFSFIQLSTVHVITINLYFSDSFSQFHHHLLSWACTDRSVFPMLCIDAVQLCRTALVRWTHIKTSSKIPWELVLFSKGSSAAAQVWVRIYPSRAFPVMAATTAPQTSRGGGGGRSQLA